MSKGEKTKFCAYTALYNRSLWNRIGENTQCNWAHPVLSESPSSSIINIAPLRRVHFPALSQVWGIAEKEFMKPYLPARMWHKALLLHASHSLVHFKMQNKDTGNYPIVWLWMQTPVQTGEVFICLLIKHPCQTPVFNATCLYIVTENKNFGSACGKNMRSWKILP